MKFKVFTYKTVYEVVAKQPTIIITPDVDDEDQAKAYALQEIQDPFLMRCEVMGPHN